MAKRQKKMQMFNEQTSADANSTGQDLASTSSFHRPRLRFVIHEHAPRTHHFDFRLEKDAKSRAVPKCPAEELKVTCLLVQVADHDTTLPDFEEQIPDGEYTAGEAPIWEQGCSGMEDWSTQRILFDPDGQRTSDRFNLIRFSGGKEFYSVGPFDGICSTQHLAQKGRT